jgi:hypothetical protein
VLSTLMSPPISSTSCLQIARPEAGAAVFAGGRGVGLHVGLEQVLLLFAAHADAGVAHIEAQGRSAALLLDAGDADRHFAVFGELDGVAEQVDQHLAQAQRVAVEAVRHAWAEQVAEFDVALLRLLGDQFDHFLEQLAQVEIDFIERSACPLPSWKSRGCC